MDRRELLGTLGTALAGVAGYGTLVEPRLLEATEHAVRLGPDGAQPGEAGSADLVVVQISDLHLKGIGALHERLARTVDEVAPDLLLFTGDTVDDRRNLPLLPEFLSLFQNDAPRVAVMGNWEYWGGVEAADLGRALAVSGGEVLVDRSLLVGLPAGELLLTGLDDWAAGSPDPTRALAGTERGAAAVAREAGRHLVLSHCPIVRDLAAGPAPWMLSGHTHGGQVSVLGLEWLPHGSGPYVEGWYRDRLPHLYVARGVGTSVVPVRIGARPEVAVFRIGLP